MKSVIYIYIYIRYSSLIMCQYIYIYIYQWSDRLWYGKHVCHFRDACIILARRNRFHATIIGFCPQIVPKELPSGWPIWRVPPPDSIVSLFQFLIPAHYYGGYEYGMIWQWGENEREKHERGKNEREKNEKHIKMRHIEKWQT